MSTVGQQLLSRIIRTGQLSPVMEFGITSEDLLTGSESKIFEVIKTYHGMKGNNGAVPGVQIMSDMFPDFHLTDEVGSTIESLCREVRQRRLQHATKEVASQVLEACELGRDPISILNAAQERLNGLLALGASRNTDVSFRDAHMRNLARYEDRKKGISTSSLSWPWEIMNEMTGGFQPDDYIVLYGRPKSKKSWVLSKIAAHAYDMGKRLLIYTKEMTPDSLLLRIAASIIRLPYQETRMAKLEPEQEWELYQLSHHIAHDPERLMCLSGQDVEEGGDTMHWLRAKIDRYKPEIVLVDGLYLMSDGSKKPAADWTRVTSVSRAARALQLATKIPLVCTVQANRKAAAHARAELDEIAYADALGQDATLAFRVIAEKGKNSIAMVIGGSREFELEGFRIGGVPATDFDYIGMLESSDVEQAKKGDTSEKEKVARKPKTPAPDNAEQLARASMGVAA